MRLTFKPGHKVDETETVDVEMWRSHSDCLAGLGIAVLGLEANVARAISQLELFLDDPQGFMAAICLSALCSFRYVFVCSVHDIASVPEATAYPMLASSCHLCRLVASCCKLVSTEMRSSAVEGGPAKSTSHVIAKGGASAANGLALDEHDCREYA